VGEASYQPEQWQTWIERMQAGDLAARDQLIGHACERLRRLTRKMLKDYPQVKRWELTDDVLQNALVRLWRALGDVTPSSAREFLGLASLQIRRELIDLARRYYGPQGVGTNQASSADNDDSAATPRALAEKAESTNEPSRLAIWTEFHQRIDSLPEEERAVVDLLWYQELTQEEAAMLLGISEATLKRRWRSARLRLHDLLREETPGDR
jgi:RNA polymerase sigma-70 factor (ECF subfamily)